MAPVPAVNLQQADRLIAASSSSKQKQSTDKDLSLESLLDIVIQPDLDPCALLQMLEDDVLSTHESSCRREEWSGPVSRRGRGWKPGRRAWESEMAGFRIQYDSLR